MFRTCLCFDERHQVEHVGLFVAALGLAGQPLGGRRGGLWGQRLEVLGSRGMLQAGNHSATTAERWTAEGVVRDKPLHFFPERYAEAYAAEIAHFLEAVARDEQPDVGAEAGRQSLLLADAAQRSFEANRPVRVG